MAAKIVDPSNSEVRSVIRFLCRGKLSSGIILLQDNTRPHTAAKTKEKIQNFRWELFDHPPYSPDFLHFKQWLGGQRFETEEGLFSQATAVRKMLRSERQLCREVK